jgi:hypothetical protein
MLRVQTVGQIGACVPPLWRWLWRREKDWLQTYPEGCAFISPHGPGRPMGALPAYVLGGCRGGVAAAASVAASL